MVLVVKKTNSKRSNNVELGDELVRFVKRSPSGFEVIMGDCIPYYEFDNKYNTKDEQELKLLDDFKIALNNVKDVFNETEYPDMNIYTFSSCGFDPVCKMYKNSFHVRIRGVGYYKCGLDIPEVKLCDKSPYSGVNKRQLLRLVGCSKEDNKRPLLRCVKELSCDDLSMYDIEELNKLDENLDDYLVTNTDGEQLINIFDKDTKENVIKLIQKESSKITKLDTMIEDIQLRDVCSLIDCLSDERANDFSTWILSIRCIKNIAEQYGLDLKDKIHEFSEKSDKYSRSEIEYFWNTDVDFDGIKISYPSLCYWAKSDNKDSYYKIIAENKKVYNESILSIINKVASDDREYEFCDYRNFINKNIDKKNENTIWKYLSDSIVHVIDGGLDKIFTVNRGINNSTMFKTISTTPFMHINDIEFTVDNIPKTMFEYFKKFYQRKSYSKIDFIPYLNDNPCDEDTFNLFQGFIKKKTDNTDMSKIQKILYHLEHVICDGDKIMYDYILKWHAHLFQKPAEKVEVAILLYSQKHGSGKNKWCDFIMSLLGNDLWYKTCKLDDLTTKFNYHMQSKLLIIGDEIANYAGYKASDQLKALITETNMAIEPKGKDPYCIKSCERYIFTTNSDVPLRIDEQDRRYCTLSVSEKYAKDTKYFGALTDEMNDEECQQIFFNYITSIDIENWDFRNIPVNEYKKELMNETIENTYTFLEHFCDENPNTSKSTTKTFYEDYTEYCKTYNTRAVDLRKFIKLLKRKGIEKKQVQVNKKRMYFFMDIQKISHLVETEETEDTPYDSDEN